MASSDLQEARAIIKLCCKLGYSPTKTFEMIQEASSERKISRTQVFEWHKRFREGRRSLEDEKGRGRKTSIDLTLVTAIKDVVDTNRRVTLRDLCNVTGYSYGTVQRVLTDKLGMTKVSARWIPRLLIRLRWCLWALPLTAPVVQALRS